MDAVQRPDVVESVNRWAQPTMQTEDLVFNESGERKVVEEIGKVFPYIGVAVFAKALVVEAVHLGDLAGFVVAAEDGNPLGVTDLQADQESHGLD